MSAGYGFFSVKFFKADGSPDPETAKKAFDWAGENLEWVKELNPFVLEGNEWSNNSNDWVDGVDIKHTGVPNDPEDWVKQVGDAVGAELITAVELQDFTESDLDAIGSYAAVYKDGKIIETKRFHKGVGSAYDSDDDEDEDDENERDFFAEADSWTSHYVPKPGSELIPSGCFLDNYGNWASLDSARYNIDGCPNRDFALLPVRAMITDDDEQWDLIAEFDIEKDEVPDLPFITMYDEEFQDYEVDDGEDWLQLGYGSGNLLDADGNTIQSLKDVDHADNEDGETVFWRVPYADLDEEKRKSGEYVLTEEARKKWSEKLGL